MALKWGWSERSPDVIWERVASVPCLHTQGLGGVGGYLRVPLILVSHPQSILVVTIRVRTRVSVSASASTATSVTVLTRATRAPTAPSVSYASGPSLLLLWVFLYTRHLPSFLEMASFACLPSTLLKHGFHGALFLVRPLVVVLLHAPCPLSSFWVLALSCVITPKGATYRFLFGPYLLIMGSSGLIRKDGLSGFHCPCS